MPAVITGNKVVLRSATMDDRQSIFEWLTQSDITHLIMGPPNFPEIEIPTWQEFCDDYNEKYFGDRDPYEGRSFIIMVGEEPVGQINYNDIDRTTKTSELDIWLRGSDYTRKGFGTDAINTLCKYLSEKLGCKQFILAPSRRNVDAINAYLKCGFKEVSEIPANFVPDYYDTVILKKSV